MTTSEPPERRSTWPGALGLLFAALVAAVTFVHFSGGIFCSLQRSHGANIDHALGLVFVGGLAGPLLMLFTRNRPRLRATVSLGAVAVLTIAIALVSVDSATYTAQRSCGFMTTTDTSINERVYYLYFLWGIPVALVLRAALSELGASAIGPRKVIPVGVIAAVALGTWALAEGGSRARSHSRPRSELPAGTKLFKEPNHDHVVGKVRYNRTPPAGGPHNDVWLNCGVYASPVRSENAVHSLEHGAVWITYEPNLKRSSVTRLQRFVESHYRGEERYLILSPYPGLKQPVVASAWGAQLTLRGPADPRLAEFVSHFAGGGQGGEPGWYCSDGTGSPVG